MALDLTDSVERCVEHFCELGDESLCLINEENFLKSQITFSVFQGMF